MQTQSQQRTSAEIVQALYDRYNEKDLDGAVADVAEDAELVDPGLGQTFSGRDGVRAWLQTFATAFPDSTARPTRMLADGDNVATEHVGTGTHTGPLASPEGEVPPTGRPIELRFGEFFELRDGKITRMTVYWDTASLARQLGLA
jgi:steroid delta-isomerase-like uncharacterized protein